MAGAALVNLVRRDEIEATYRSLAFERVDLETLTERRPDRARSEIANVRFGSKADIRRYPVERPLLGVKQTLVRG